MENNTEKTNTEAQIQPTEGQNPPIYNDYTGEYLEKCRYVDNLSDFGVFTQQQAQNLKQKMISELNGKYESKTNKMNAFRDFEKESPNFFENRSELKKYLEEAEVELNSAEFNKIADLVKKIEENALSRYMVEFQANEMMKNANKTAKGKLQTPSFQAESRFEGGKKIFTAAEIGAMSSEEFRKNEATINEQLKKGLIK